MLNSTTLPLSFSSSKIFLDLINVFELEYKHEEQRARLSSCDLFIFSSGLRGLHCEQLGAIQHVDNLLIIKFFIHSLYTP